MCALSSFLGLQGPQQRDVEGRFRCNESSPTVQVVKSSLSKEKALQSTIAKDVEFYFQNRMKDMYFTKGLFPELVSKNYFTAKCRTA